MHDTVESFQDRSGVKSNSRDLGTLIYSMSVALVARSLLSRLWLAYVATVIKNDFSHSTPLINLYSPTFILLLSFVSLSGVILFYWPVRATQAKDGNYASHEWSMAKKVLWGVAVGLAAFIVAVPFLLGETSLTGMTTEIHYCHTCVSVIVSGCVLVIGLPIVVEVVFRRIVLETIRPLASLGASIVVSCGLSIFLWPTFPWLIASIFGVASCLLYERTRSIVPSIVANMTLSALALAIQTYLTGR